MSEVADGTRFALASLAVWRVTHLLVEEDGPADAVVRLRARLGNTQLGRLLDCFYCLSVWVAAPASVAAARSRREVPLTCLALSGAACPSARLANLSRPAPRPSTGKDWAMSCCGKKRKALDPNQRTLASPLGTLQPGAAKTAPRAAPRRGDGGRDAPVTAGR